MEKYFVLFCVTIGCFAILIPGCAGINTHDIQRKLMMMSDKELIDHYEMLDMRMVDIDRKEEQSVEQTRYIQNNNDYETHYNQLGHLHIGDNWAKLKKEKDLTRDEMRKRGLPFP